MESPVVKRKTKLNLVKNRIWLWLTHDLTNRRTATQETRILNRGSAQPEVTQISEKGNRQAGSGSVRKRPISLSPTPTSRRPNLITAGGEQLKALSPREVVVKDSYRQDTSVVIQWESETSNILGFRVVYRLFGDDAFQPGPPLDPSAREFIIKNVPHQVISSEFDSINLLICCSSKSQIKIDRSISFFEKQTNKQTNKHKSMNRFVTRSN